METLPEIAVADADPATAEIYRRIMAASGTGTPALIIRHFAVFPGFLDWVWSAVGPEIEGGLVLRHALDAVDRAPRLEVPRVDAGDLTGVDLAALGAIFANYNRMNPMNHSLIAAVRALVAGDEAGVAPDLPAPVAGPPMPCPPLPAPVSVTDLPVDLQEVLAELSRAVPGDEVTVVPTLYRHLAIWPDLMRRLAQPVMDALDAGEVRRCMDGLEREIAPLVASVIARARDRAMPPPPLADPGAMVRTLDAFLVAIPMMTVIGCGLEDAMPPKVPRWR